MKHELVYSALITPDGTILESLHRHDFKKYEDKNHKTYILDGGLDYVHSSCNGDEKFIQVYADEDFEKVRLYAYRVARGADGKGGPFVRVPLAVLTDIHLESVLVHLNGVLDDRAKLSNTHYRLLKMEKAWRIAKQVWTL